MSLWPRLDCSYVSTPSSQGKVALPQSRGIRNGIVVGMPWNVNGRLILYSTYVYLALLCLINLNIPIFYLRKNGKVQTKWRRCSLPVISEWIWTVDVWLKAHVISGVVGHRKLHYFSCFKHPAHHSSFLQCAEINVEKIITGYNNRSTEMKITTNYMKFVI